MKFSPVFGSPRGAFWPGRARSRGGAGIALLAAAVVAGVVITLLYWGHVTVERELVATFQRHQLTTARSLAAAIEEVFDEVEDDVQEFARHHEIQDSAADVQRALDASYETHTDILNSITVIDASGTRLFRSPATAKTHSVAQWPEFIAVRATMRPHVGELATCVIDTSEKVVRVFVPVIRDGKFSGAIYASVNLKKLWAKCLKRPETGRKSLCWVIENDGMLLYHTNRAYWYRTWDDIEREWRASRKETSEEEEGLEKALRRRVQDGEEGMAEYKNNLAGGVVELLAFTPARLGNEQYGLAVVTPKSEIAGPIDAHMRVTYALTAGIVVFLTVAGGIVYRGAAMRARLAEEKTRTAELAKSRRYLQTVIDAIGDDVIVIGRDHRIALVNRAAREKAGGEDPVERGMTCYQLSHGFDTPCNGKEDPCPLEQVFATKLPVSTTHNHRDADGNEVVAEIAGWPIFDEAGEVVQIIEHCRDITERVRAEEALRESEEKYRQLFTTETDAIMLFDAETRQFLDVNDAAVRLYGYGKGEFLKLKHTDITAEAEESDRSIGQVIAGQLERIPLRYHRKKDGTVFPVEIAASTLMLQGRLVMCGVIHDITERKRAEEERRKLEEQVQHAQKLESLGVLAGGIAHDFNNLLVGIMGNAEMALTELPPESPARYSLREIETASQRAAELCRQMLAYSGKGHFVIEPLDLSRLVEEMAHLLEASISKKAVVKYDLSGELPAVEADATQLRQIVMNLITNASEAIGDKGGVITVRTGMMEADRAYLATAYMAEELPEGPYMYLEVADTGCGMDEETLSKVFDPFFSTKFTGRGLGLAAVLGIVRGHRGALKIYSEPGKGTTFKVILPCSDEPAADARRQKAADGAWHCSATVLVVDDEDTARTIAKRMLEPAGLTVLTAADGRKGRVTVP